MAPDAPEESGIEELLRLSREIGNMEKELVQDLGRARTKLERAEKRQALLSLVKDLKVSIVSEQLRSVATRRIVNTIESYIKSRDTRDLKNLISDVVYELEKRFSVEPSGAESHRYTGIPSLSTEHLIKTLSILIEFLFYVE